MKMGYVLLIETMDYATGEIVREFEYSTDRNVLGNRSEKCLSEFLRKSKENDCTDITVEMDIVLSELGYVEVKFKEVEVTEDSELFVYHIKDMNEHKKSESEEFYVTEDIKVCYDKLNSFRKLSDFTEEDWYLNSERDMESKCFSNDNFEQYIYFSISKVESV